MNVRACHLTVSSFFLLCIDQAYLNPELDFIHVSAIDIFLFFAFYFVVNFIILITWTFVSPLTWSRIYDDATDVFDRPTESYAVCQSDQSLPFVITLAVLNLGFLVIGNWWAYRSRNIETEYNESSYIGVSMAATLQAWAMGIPILIVVWDSPPAKFYVSVGIVFVTAQAVLSLVYVPKVIALRKNLQSSHEQKKAEQFASYKEKSGHMTKKDYSKGDSEINGDESESPEDNGDSLGGARRENISTAEMSEVEHNPQEAENNGTDEANEGRPSSGSSTRGSRFGGAISSKDVDENRVGGIRVTYNPRVSNCIRHDLSVARRSSLTSCFFTVD